MKYEIKIILGEESYKSENGKVLENLVRIILERQEYEIYQNIHFTGLEIDLVARHKIKKEILYVECKAKEKPKSTEIKNFVYGVDYGVEDNNVDYGYFIHTEDLDRQAGALKLKIESSKNNITFIGPEAMLQLLINSNTIVSFPSEMVSQIITKLILACTPSGYFYVAILQEGIVPTNAVICNAKDLNSPPSVDLIDFLKKSIKELRDLDIILLVPKENIDAYQANKLKSRELIESITEIKESETWYDYAPASINHFIGRIRLRQELLNFIENVQLRKTKNRIFYLDGKSGWGKSSLIAELRGRSKTKFLKKKLFVLAIDTRSAVTSNFVAFSFRKLIDDAISSTFFPHSLFFNQLTITSPYDILSDQSIKDFFAELRRRKKTLVIIFDQFEDIFRKENLFDVFYKFLLDANEFQENLVVGFSWKSEINIPIGNAAYHLFSQLKDYSINLRIPEFSLNDVKSVIKQLARTINKPLGNELERRLIDASQGFPWLIKKLCIHTYSQYLEGKTLEELIEQDLNIKSLFQSDLEKLTSEESSILTFIANRSFEDNAFDISELDEIDQEALSQLIHKRLVIKTGTKYNIYWDIFRDYLVTGHIPVIGESYLIRQSPNACLDLFLIFKDRFPKKEEELKDNYPITITKKTLWNLLFDLRSIGVIKRKEEGGVFELSNPDMEVSKNEFSNYITTKFQNYTPYLELLKIEKQEISLEDIVNILKSIFKTSQFREATWKAYALNLALWLRISNLPIKNKIIAAKKGRGATYKIDLESVLFNTPLVLIKAYERIKKGHKISNRLVRDLFYLKLFDQLDDSVYKITEEKKNLDLASEDFLKLICNEAIRLRKLKDSYHYVQANNLSTVSDFVKACPYLVKEYKTSKSKNQIGSILLAWGKFIYKVLDNENTFLDLKAGRSKKNFFDYCSPNELEKIYQLIVTNTEVLDKYDKLKMNLLLRQNKFFTKESSLTQLILLDEYKNLELFREGVLNSAKDQMEIKTLLAEVNRYPKLKSQELVNHFPRFFDDLHSPLSKRNKASRLLQWVRVIKKEFQF